jgi:hypothetical protein
MTFFVLLVTQHFSVCRRYLRNLFETGYSELNFADCCVRTMPSSFLSTVSTREKFQKLPITVAYLSTAQVILLVTISVVEEISGE